MALNAEKREREKKRIRLSRIEEVLVIAKAFVKYHKES